MLFNSSLERQAQHRTNDDYISKQFEGEQSKITVWHKGKILIKNNRFSYFQYSDISSLINNFSPAIYLSHNEKHHYFAIQLIDWDKTFNGFELIDLRSVSPFVDEFNLSLLFYSQGLLNWHHNHYYCAKCGCDTEITNAGHVRKCCNPNCAKEHYPRTDPAVIFSIINKTGNDEKVLLARQSNWDENRYSVIAGFVEPGESLEDAVKREAYEEVGLSVNNIQYQVSQPWPFPSSIMLGFSCETLDHEIRLIDQELEKAQWFSATEITQKVKSGELKLPFSISISYHLLNGWFEQQMGYSLKQLTKD